MSITLFNIDFFRNFGLVLTPSLLVPDFEVKTIYEVQNVLGPTIKGIIIDVDQTIVAYGNLLVDDGIQEELARVKSLYLCCLLSNFPKTSAKRERLKGIEMQIGIPIVLAKRKKPDPEAFQAALEELKLKPGQVAMVGDRVFTDIMGANNCGIVTVLVCPLNSKTDPYVMVTIPRLIEQACLKIIKIFYRRRRNEI